MDILQNAADILSQQEPLGETEDSTEELSTACTEEPLPREIVISSPFGDSRDGIRPECYVALPLLKQRLGYLWEKKMYTDVVFIVGPDQARIEAHRVILASASYIFQQMLFDQAKPLLMDDKFVLYENDFSESAFEVFIKAMYTNEVPICLTLALALEVFYVTKKYAVVFLEDQIFEHIRQLLTVSNVFEALRLSTNAIELTYLAPICWKIVEEQTSAVLEYHFDDLDAHTFSKVLERDRLNMEEVELFQIAVRWAANICKTQGMKTIGKNKRHFMEPLIKLFRFTTMTLREFNDVVIPSRILDTKEVQHIQCVLNKGTDLRLAHQLQLPYKTSPRLNTTKLKVKEEMPRLFSQSERCIISNHGKDDVPKIQSDSAVLVSRRGPRPSSRAKTRRATTTHTSRHLKSRS